ncbi:MAG: hypothetical protein JXR07_06030 [Reichenbachiella sp.]
MAKNSIQILLVLLFMAWSTISPAQPYGNEWIESNQNYFKFKIKESGIYRINRSDLLNGGFPVGSIDPRRIQIYNHGEEIAIKIEGQSDGVFDNDDFIEFYAKSIDGTSDTELYFEQNSQPHDLYNLFSDSAVYFLTYRLDLGNGLRMEEFFENNIGNLPAENSYKSTIVQINSSRYYAGRSYNPSQQVLLGDYDNGEGWTGEFASRGQSLNFTLTGLNDQYSSGSVPRLKLLLQGANNNAHNIDIYVGPSSSALRLVSTAEFNGDDSFLVEQDLLLSDLSASGEIAIRATINGVNGAADRAAVSYMSVTYERAFDLNNNEFQNIQLNAIPIGKSYIELTNAPNNVHIYDITEKENPIIIGFNASGSDINAIVDNTSSIRELYLQSNTKSIAGLIEVDFSSIDPTSFNLLVVTHSSLRENTSDGQTDQVLAYKNYRESLQGGGHQVLITNIDQLFDQFNYGEQSPLAIRRFCQYMYDNGSPDFLFLIGKASNNSANYYRQNPETSTTRHFVPTYGHPGSDAAFTAGFDGGRGYETIATGRINADSPDHVQAYINKVIEEESLPVDNLRRKNLVHLSGGNSENELNAFRFFIDGFAEAAADKWLGGESAQISKNNNSAVELINISDEINEGTMMVTFFGHSSGSVTDIEIGLVSDPSFGYANRGKYPVFMVNGCLAGDFFSENESFGVDWILTPNLGATAFMAHSHVGFSNNLRRFTNKFYELAFNNPDYIVKTVGEIKRETAKQFINIYGSNSPSNIAQVQLVNLQGDPASFVFGGQKPDFSIDQNLVYFKSFDNAPILASTDSFYVEMNIKNFGIATDSTLNIEVVRTLGDGSSITYGPIVYEPTLREDTVLFTIPNDITNSAGSNIFNIVLDPFNSIDEIDKSNNSVTLPLFLSDGSTINLLPTPFSIQNTSTLDFYFQASNILTTTRSFDFQLDTLKTFNSPYNISRTISTNVAGVIELDLESQGAISNGKVFYWRTRFTDPLPNESNDWITSSFTLDKSMSEGWTQQKPGQLSELSIEGLALNENNGLWEFVSNSVNLDVTNFGSAHPSLTYSDTEVLIDGQNQFKTNSTLTNAHCRNNTINFLAFKRQSSVPFRPFTFTSPDELNALVCGRLPQYIINYAAGNMSGSNNPIEYIDALENGDKVLVFSLGQVDYSTWTDEFKSSLELLGINRTLLDNLVDDEPIIFLGAKGAPANSAVFERASTAPVNQAALNLDDNIIGNFDSGSISSDRIGPATEWGNFSMDIVPSSNPTDDSRLFNIIAIDISGNESNVFQSDTETQVDLGPNGLNLNPDTYPYVRLQLELYDDVQFTPEQLKTWQTEYTTAPEAVLLKRDRSDLISVNERQEGAPLSTSFTLWNISAKDFKDSIQVKHDLFNTLNSATYSDSIKLAPLMAGDSTNIELNILTRNRVGSHDLIVNANRLVQPEIYYINNESRLVNFVQISADEVNPILEVSFDGIVIMDGDIVSPNPSININVTDDNEYILKEDTLGMNFYIKRPCENCDFERVAFSNPTVTWSPANADSPFQIDYQPEPLEDGLYGLRVQAEDGSGNESGIEPYEINFEVINESTITNFYPYPNPFSSSTRFVFTLTGSEIPEDIKIQIMTISGRIVKEIFMDELGSINIGNNKTDYAWDGRDNFGDQLANGVYLYRVLIKNPGENFEHRNTSGDRGFKNGYGKMYLLR